MAYGAYSRSMEGGGGITGVRADGTLRDNVSPVIRYKLGARLTDFEAVDIVPSETVVQAEQTTPKATGFHPLQAARLAVAGAFARVHRS